MTNSRVKSTHQTVILGSDFTTTSATFVDVTGMAVTLPKNSGSSLILFYIVHDSTNVAVTTQMVLVDNTTLQEQNVIIQAVNDQQEQNTMVITADNNGQVIKLQAHIDGSATLTISGTANRKSYIEVLSH